MKRPDRTRENEIYYAGQWAGAGLYRCLDPCLPWERDVILAEDGFLPDPTHGWVARFRRVRGSRAERLLARRPATPGETTDGDERETAGLRSGATSGG